jgi:branched-chain amino acid transport system permease protein
MDNIRLLADVPLLNVQLLLDGFLIGSIFALAAYGFALVWGVMNVINFAQGEMVIMGGYIAVVLGQNGIHPILGMPVAFVLMFGFGWIAYLVVVAWVVDRDMFTSLLATFGLSILLQQLLNLYFGSEVLVADAGLPIWSAFDGMVTISGIKVVSFVLAAVLATSLIVFMKRSRLGQAIRATSQDRRAARVLGINTDRVYAMTYALNSAICGAAGALVAMIWSVQPYFGIIHSLRSFMIVTVAGFGNLPGVIIAGLGLGAGEQFAAFILGSEFQIAFVVGLLLLVLVVRQYRQGRKRQAVGRSLAGGVK